MLSSEQELRAGDKYREKTIREAIRFPNGEYLIKTDDSKSDRDFKVKLVVRLHPTRKSITPKHAHFAIDLYGKLSASKEGGVSVFRAIIEIWQGEDVASTVTKHHDSTSGLPGYGLDYILRALKWILLAVSCSFQRGFLHG